MKLGVLMCGACEGTLRQYTFKLLGLLFGSFFHVSQSCPGHVRRGLGKRTEEEVQDCVGFLLFFLFS